jgi:tetratricopeptide (TPR) repeat protein
MRLALRSHLLGAVSCVVIMFSTIAYGADDPVTQPDASLAESLVTKALQAEAAGNAAERDSCIEKALAADPDYAPAHWHHGDVRARERGVEVWKPIDEAAKDLAQRGKVEQYRKLNPTANRKAEQWRNLGEWCDDAGLFGPALLHRTTALRMKPNLRDVQQKLGLVRYRNGFVAADQLEQIQKDEQAYAESFKHWTRRLERLQRDASVDSPNRQALASQELREIEDPAAIPAMEALSVEGGPVFGVAVTESMAKMSAGAATNALLRQAVCSQYPEVRQAASIALREKNLFAYAPTLIGMLKAPIRFQETEASGDHTGAHQMIMFQEGPFAAQAFVSIGTDSRDTLLEISHETHRPAWFKDD